MIADEKECPFCLELIKARAVVCRYCGRDLSTQPVSVIPTATTIPPIAPPIAKRKRRQAPFKIPDCDIAELLSSIVSRCLIVFDESTGRYRLLETVRQYARDRLLESGSSDLWRYRHRDFFLALAEEAEPRCMGPEQAEWLGRLDSEHENLRTSLDWSFGEESAEAGLRLCGALQRYWWMRGYLTEGRDWCEQALGKGKERTKERAKALNGIGGLAYYQGDYAAAQDYHEESLSIQREIGDRAGIANSLGNLGNLASSRGDLASARAYHEESLSIDRETGNRRGIAISLGNLGNVASDQGDNASARAYYEETYSLFRELGDRWGIAGSLANLGNVAHFQGDRASARSYFEESLNVFRVIGDRRGVAYSLNGLGVVTSIQGDYSSARGYHRESLSIYKEIGDRLGIAYSLEAFARLMAGHHQVERAARYWGAAETLREEIGAPLPPNEREEYDRLLASASQDLGEAAFSRAWAEGRAMTLEQAIELALSEGES